MLARRSAFIPFQDCYSGVLLRIAASLTVARVSRWPGHEMSQSLVVSVLVFPMILDCILNANVEIQDPRESATRNTCSLIVVQV